MEKKLKFSEFAELIGVTAKTVYKMKDREEIRTVIEKVNGREIQLVITTPDEIEKFRLMNGKGTNNNGNYEDMLTDNEGQLNNNNYSQSTEDKETLKEILEKFIDANKEYNNHIKKLNEELIDSKSKLLLLEDKASREGLYLQEINELKKENETLKGAQKTVTYILLTVSVALLLVIVGLITFNVTQNTDNEIQAQKKDHVQQEVQIKAEQPAKHGRVTR